MVDYNHAVNQLIEREILASYRWSMNTCQWIRDFYGLWQFSFWGIHPMRHEREKGAKLPVGNLPTDWIMGMIEICVCSGEVESPGKSSIQTKGVL